MLINVINSINISIIVRYEIVSVGATQTDRFTNWFKGLIHHSLRRRSCVHCASFACKYTSFWTWYLTNRYKSINQIRQQLFTLNSNKFSFNIFHPIISFIISKSSLCYFFFVCFSSLCDNFFLCTILIHLCIK